MSTKIGYLILRRSCIFRQRCFYSDSKSSTSKMLTEINSGVKLTEAISALEQFAPKELSESWDNTGLLIEPFTPRNISKVLLTNDLTEDVALEAKQQGCELIISYHPPIFAPLKSVTQKLWKERIVSLLLENGIALYSPHTSWDSVQGGVNDWLASAFPASISNPILKNEDPKTGAGRLLELEPCITLGDAVTRVKKLTGLQYVRLAVGRGKTTAGVIHKVALCAGSGASVLKNVHDVDLFLTGEMFHHDVLDATQRGISIVLTNHSDSERGFLQVFAKTFKERLENVDVLVSKCDKDPLCTV